MVTILIYPSDKRLWWILLPALLVAGAGAIYLKFRSKKVHEHTGRRGPTWPPSA